MNWGAVSNTVQCGLRSGPGGADLVHELGCRIPHSTMRSMCDSQNVLVARVGPGGANLFHVLFFGVSHFDIALPLLGLGNPRLQNSIYYNNDLLHLFFNIGLVLVSLFFCQGGLPGPIYFILDLHLGRSTFFEGVYSI